MTANLGDEYSLLAVKSKVLQVKKSNQLCTCVDDINIHICSARWY